MLASRRAAAETGFRAAWLANLLTAAAIALLALYAAAFAYHAAVTLPYPFPLDYGEGASLNAAERVARGLPIYTPYDRLPGVSANYPPVFFLLHGALNAAFGTSLTWGRLVAFAASIAAAAAIWQAVPKAGRRARLIAVLLWASLGPVYAWSAIDKGDMLAIALSLWGVVLATRGRLAVAGLVLGLAAMTKQTALLPLAVVAIWLVVRPPEGRRRDAGLLLGPAGGVIVLVSGAAMAWLGQDYLDHVVFSNVQAVSPVQAAVALLILLRDHWPLLVGAAVVSILAVRRGATIWHVYWLAALAALAVTSGKTGAYTNYYLELLALSVIVVAGRFGALQGVAVPVAAGLLLGQAVLLVHLPHVREYAPTPSASTLAEHQAVERALATAPGPIFSENAAWTVRRGETPAVDDPFLFTQLAAAGRWDPSQLLALIDGGELPVVLLEFDPRAPDRAGFHLERFPRPVVEALARRYNVHQIGAYWLLTLH